MSAQTGVRHDLIQDAVDPVIRDTVVVLKKDAIVFFTPLESCKGHTTQQIMTKLGYKPEPFSHLMIRNGWLFFEVS